MHSLFWIPFDPSIKQTYEYELSMSRNLLDSIMENTTYMKKSKKKK